MEEYTIVTQGSATYLERTLGADELLDEVDRGMLVSNQISGVLPLNIQWINADCRLLYNITGLTPLVQAARILEHETRLSNFFMALCRAEKECDEYLLDPHKIDLTPEHIYLDAAGHAYVMYVPVQAALDKYTPTELAGYVLRMIGRQMSHDSRVISVLSRQLLYGEKFSFVDLEKQIEDDSGDKIYRKELLMLEITYYEKNEDYNKAYEIAGQLVSEYPDYEKGQKEYTFLSTRVSQ